MLAKQLLPGSFVIDGHVHGQLLKDYSLVVLLRLRSEHARKVKELFPYFDKSESESLVGDVKKTHGESILFVLEGFDELPEKMRMESIYLDLIVGSKLPYSTVLVTSHPWAVSDFHWK